MNLIPGAKLMQKLKVSRVLIRFLDMIASSWDSWYRIDPLQSGTAAPSWVTLRL